MPDHAQVVFNESTPLLQNDSSQICLCDEQNECQMEDTVQNEVETVKLISPTPLPLRALGVIMMLRATAPLAFLIIFPFVNQMILEVGIVDDPEEVGFYSGLIESTFSLLSLITVMPVSYLADQVGRKPIILWGTLAMGISTAFFGMSKTLRAMILARCIGGATGSVWVATKTVVAEYTDNTNQVKAFQYLTIAYRGSQMLALPLGGLLVHPERTFSIALFQSRFWRENPFALPCFVAAAIAVISVILGYFLLEETLKSKRKRSIEGAGVDSDTPGGDSLREILTPPVVKLLLNNIIILALFSFTPVSSGGLGLTEAAIGLQMSIRGFLHIGMMLLYPRIELHFGSTFRLYRVIMFIWPVVVCCMPALNALARLFGTHSPQVSLAMLVFLSLWGFCGLAWSKLKTSLAFQTLDYDQPLASTIIMITDASPSERALSRINGISQITSILPQVIAPAASTSFFAYSVKSQIFGGHLIWIVLFFVACAGAIHSLTLKETVNSWRTKAV